MHEGPVFEGRGVPPKSPVEWVKHKLAVRYTERGRIGAEVDKIEKVMGPLSEEQRAEAAERLHLEGKIKNKVVRTVVGDAIVATVVVGGTGYLIARPDARANISKAISVSTKAAGEGVSKRLDQTIIKLKPADGQKAKFGTAILLPLITAAKAVTDRGTAGVTRVFDSATHASLRSMEGRVINARRRLSNVVDQGDASTEAMQNRRTKAAEHVANLEKRHAKSMVITDQILPVVPDSIRANTTVMNSIIESQVDMQTAKNRLQYPVTEAMPAARKLRTKEDLAKHMQAAEDAFQKAMAGTDKQAQIAAGEAQNQAEYTRLAWEQLADEKAARDAETAMRKSQREQKKSARKAKKPPEPEIKIVDQG